MYSGFKPRLDACRVRQLVTKSEAALGTVLLLCLVKYSYVVIDAELPES